MEFKSYFYNYDDAANLGKGPAYVTGPGGFFSCDLPGCYLDSDFASSKNGAGEYSEPQIGFGIAPGNGNQVDLTKDYYAITRAIAGRGNTSLMKARDHITTEVVSALGVSGIFLCGDVVPLNVIAFQDGIYAPNCVRVFANPKSQEKC